MHRRHILRRALVAASAAPVLAVPVIVRAQSAPFRIGLLTVKTGPLAQGGIQMEQGLATFLKEKNSTLAGRNVTNAFQDYYSNEPGLLRSREILGPVWTLGVRGRF